MTHPDPKALIATMNLDIARMQADDRHRREELGRYTTAMASIAKADKPTPRYGHGGYDVGDAVTWTNPMGIDTHPGVVQGLHRNGNLCIRELEHGTTIDVHYTHVLPRNP